MGQPGFGLREAKYAALADEVDVVYHCGAIVSLGAPYETAREANVTGTVNVLASATQAGGAPVNHVSTLGTLVRRFREGATGPIREDEPLPDRSKSDTARASSSPRYWRARRYGRDFRSPCTRRE
ncbi:SDR family oxidoreductase [Kitasatospora sp. NPDC058046]|uniref:SDR family oxidoreductase n=1 Tax=Kitasatospora sp. NPDC058046 TaxID=3346312 RepID=UPI0036DA8639